MEQRREPLPSRTRRFTRAEYWRMIESGILGGDERIELLEGEIVAMSPQLGRHSKVVSLLEAALRQAFGPGHWVRGQMPLGLSDDNEPEPDVAVVKGTPDDYDNREQPSSALLVVEVSETTLATDRRKARIYAEAGIADYWIANLVESVLEIHRAPQRLTGGDWGYSDVNRFEAPARVTPLALPGGSVALADFMR